MPLLEDREATVRLGDVEPVPRGRLLAEGELVALRHEVAEIPGKLLEVRLVDDRHPCARHHVNPESRLRDHGVGHLVDREGHRQFCCLAVLVGQRVDRCLEAENPESLDEEGGLVLLETPQRDQRVARVARPAVDVHLGGGLELLEGRILDPALVVLVGEVGHLLRVEGLSGRDASEAICDICHGTSPWIGACGLSATFAFYHLLRFVSILCYSIYTMSVLDHPRHQIVNEALAFTREITKGQIIDGSTVLRHAVGVVITLEKYVPEVQPETAAGIILHDVPDAKVNEETIHKGLARFPAASLEVIRGIQQEHSYMAPGMGEGYNKHLRQYVNSLRTNHNRSILLAVSADKIVALNSFEKRAASHPNEQDFWASRGAFRRRMPYFKGFVDDTADCLPDELSRDLGNLVQSLSMRLNRFTTHQ